MNLTVTMQSIKPVTKDPEIASLGGFQLKAPDGRTFFLDWECITWVSTVNSEGYGIITATLSRLDSVFDEENQKQGFTPDQIDFNLVSSSEFIEFNYECYQDLEDEKASNYLPLKLTRMSLTSNLGTVEKVYSQDELNQINQHIAEQENREHTS